MLSTHWLPGCCAVSPLARRRLHVGVQHGVFGVAQLLGLVGIERGEAVVTEMGDVGADADEEVNL